MDEITLKAWLTLARTPNIGPLRFAEIVNKFESPLAYLETQKAPAKEIQTGVEKDLRWAEGKHCHVITMQHDDYPLALKEIADPPPVLFVKGHRKALSHPQVAIVGSRSATLAGKDRAFEMAAMLATGGLSITSGLAIGIDTYAHKGALAAQGQTIAVMATGPERLYPTENTVLAARVQQAGALITEMPVGTAVKSGLFPRRNRLISGLSLGTLVIEAGIKSGALGTAQQALEQNREVMAMPGPVQSPVARGCHSLIRKGASLIETAQDVYHTLGWSDLMAGSTGSAEKTSPITRLDADSQRVIDALGHEPVGFDALVNQLGLTPDRLSSMLLNLELLGLLIPTDGGQYERSKQHRRADERKRL